MKLTLTVKGSPPVRCADRKSPNAGPLASVGKGVVAERPEVFPLKEPFGITVVFGGTIPDVAPDGYGPVDPIIEVLTDIGMIADERLESWERVVQDSEAGDCYRVTIEPVGP